MASALAVGIAGCPKDEGIQAAPMDAGPSKDEQAVVRILETLADRLLPADEDGPGARALGISTFFARVLQDDRLAAVHPLLRRGALFLASAALAEQKRPFVDLSQQAQDDLIARLADNKMRPDGFSGPTFVRIALALTLEGALGDPRHGGNKGGAGWKMVGFSPDGRAAALKVVP